MIVEPRTSQRGALPRRVIDTFCVDSDDARSPAFPEVQQCSGEVGGVVDGGERGLVGSEFGQLRIAVSQATEGRQEEECIAEHRDQHDAQRVPAARVVGFMSDDRLKLQATELVGRCARHVDTRAYEASAERLRVRAGDHQKPVSGDAAITDDVECVEESPATADLAAGGERSAA